MQTIINKAKATHLSIILSSGLFLIFLINACKKPDNPQPVEQELITTVQLTIGDSVNFKKYKYYVANGMGGTSTATVDSIILKAGSAYPVSIQILNEQANPIEDVTEEIIAENNAHLFIWQSKPMNGAGSLIFSGGNLDTAHMPFNQKGYLTTGAAGDGKITLTLLHLPEHKNATNVEEAGGNTDAVAIFPVRITP